MWRKITRVADLADKLSAIVYNQPGTPQTLEYHVGAIRRDSGPIVDSLRVVVSYSFAGTNT